MRASFVKRNKPIFAVGILFAILFSVMIVMSQKNTSGISLVESVGDIFDDEKEVIFNPANDITGPNSRALTEEVTETSEGTTSTSTALTTPQIPGILEIAFTATGFSPNIANATKGQAVRWENATDKEIVIKELIKKHAEFASGVTILPNASFELKLYGTKLWTFEEVGSGKIGRLYIAEGN